MSINWQGTDAGTQPATVVAMINLADNGVGGLQPVQLEAVQNGQPVPVFNLDQPSDCQLDNQNTAATDIQYLDSGNQALCQPVYKTAQLGFTPFHFVVYANNDTATAAAQSRDWVCTGSISSGESCNPA